jgi:hypothetical protein
MGTPKSKVFSSLRRGQRKMTWTVRFGALKLSRARLTERHGLLITF